METIAVVKDGQITVPVDAPDGTKMRITAEPADPALARLDALRQASPARFESLEELKRLIEEGRK